MRDGIKRILCGVATASVILIMLQPSSMAAPSGASPRWVRQFGSADDDRATGIAVDGGSVYVSGHTEFDAFVGKYLSSGKEVWTQQFGTANDDSANAVAAGRSGIYVSGHVGSEAFLRKYDSHGALVWSREFGTGFGDIANGVATDDSGVYVVGVTFGTLSGTSAGASDAFVRKYDHDGVEQWTSQFGTPAFDAANGVAADGSGVYVAGEFGGPRPGDPLGINAFLRKYDASGSVQWTSTFGTADEDKAHAVSIGPAGLYVAGHTKGTLGASSFGGFDGFVSRFDSAGLLLWTRQVGTANADLLFAVNSAKTAVLTAGRIGTSGDDAYLAEWDPDGNAIWTLAFGTSAHEEATGVVSQASRITVSGWTDGSLAGHLNLGGDDAFLAGF